MPITKQVNPQANVKQRTDSDDLASSSSSAASAGINYILNPNFESDTSGYATYADAAAATPVDGTGGSPNVTLSRTTSSPLRGSASGLFTKDAANRQGQGWSYDFTIDDADRAKVLGIEFDYIINSGSFTAGSPSTDSDIEMWIYDKTNAILIPVTPFKMVSNSSSNPETFKGVFQTSSNSTSYRLIWHVATTNASAWSFKIDNVSVGPQIVLNAPNIGDWTDYSLTNTQGFGTVTSAKARYRIVGDSVEINVGFTTGTVTASLAEVNLPPGMVVDSAKITQGVIVGTAAAGNNGDAYYTVLAGPGSTFVTFGIQQSTRNSLTSYNGSDIVGSTTSWALWATIPIAGLSSNTVTGNDADARVVAAHIGLTSSYAVTSGNVVKFDTIVFDTHAGYNPSTGLYTVPVSGKYRVTAAGIANSNGSFYVVKNGAHDEFITTIATGRIDSGTAFIDCKAGDTLGVYQDSSITVTGNVPFESYISFEKVSGPALPLATELVIASYYQDGSGNYTPGSGVVIAFANKEIDTHNAVSGGQFTAPVSGLYLAMFTSNGNATGTVFAYKNGSSQKIVTQTSGNGAGGSVTYFCKAGDVLSFKDNDGSTYNAGTQTWMLVK